MRKILVANVKGNEILAKSIYSNFDTVLIPKGNKIQLSYVKKLQELHIESIYVEDDISQGIDENDITEIQIKEHCQNSVIQTINKYACSENNEFKELEKVANNIIEDMLSQPEIMFNISGVRQKNEGIYSHSLNVCAISVLLALRLKLPIETVREIAKGSMLHDIGFVQIPKERIKHRYLKDMEEKEIRTYRMHVIHGYTAVENVDWLSKEAKEIILSHHECMDGKGYPMHLTGDRISIGTKIVALCDYFDNLVYGNFVKSVKVHEAIEMITALSNRKFDEEVVKVFNESVAAYPIGTIVLTNQGETGIVLRQNNHFPTRPVIRIIKANGKTLSEWVERDLTKELSLFIEDTIEDI